MATKKDEKALVTQGTQAVGAVMDYGDDAVVVGEGPAKGYEHQSAQDGAMPFMVILQPMTPAVSEGTVDGAKAGMVMNTVTKQLFGNPEGVLFVPATTRHQYTEFVPRERGGGFRGQHEIDSPIVKAAVAKSKEFGEYYTPDGNELIETFYVFGAICSEQGEALYPAVIAFTSSKIKVYKNWISTIRQHTLPHPQDPTKKIIPPLYAHLTRLTTEMKKNDKGVFHVPVLRPAIENSVPKSLLDRTDPRFQLAKVCKELVDGGQAKVNYDQAQGENRSDDGPPPF